MRTLGLIPARMGSKRIPDKNLQLVNGRPLVERAIICAKAALVLDLIVVSSDDERVKLIADVHDVAFLMRPDELAQDDTPMSKVVCHALDQYDGFGYDTVCILEPTATFRRSVHIDLAIQELITHKNAESVRTVHELALPRFAHFINEHGFLTPVNSRDYNLDGGRYPVYVDNGIANVVRAGSPMFGHKVWPLVIKDADRGLDIDTLEDLARARMMAHDLDRV